MNQLNQKVYDIKFLWYLTVYFILIALWLVFSLLVTDAQPLWHVALYTQTDRQDRLVQPSTPNESWNKKAGCGQLDKRHRSSVSNVIRWTGIVITRRRAPASNSAACYRNNGCWLSGK